MVYLEQWKEFGDERAGKAPHLPTAGKCGLHTDCAEDADKNFVMFDSLAARAARMPSAERNWAFWPALPALRGCGKSDFESR